jgi:hypothetical protein
MRMKNIAFGLTFAVLLIPALAAHAPKGRQSDPNTLTAAERAAGWRLLFDGKTTAGWRGYKKTDVPAGWQVVDGALTRTGPGGDIITIDRFGSFDLAFEWKVAPGGNSGVMYRVTEEYDTPWQSGPEYQILDNSGHKDGANPETSTASDYALHAPVKDVSKPVGQWNQSRIVIDGKKVEHWLNGVKLVEYEIESADWAERVKKSKFAKYPNFGLAARGHLALQDHGDTVAYRNIKILVKDK